MEVEGAVNKPAGFQRRLCSTRSGRGAPPPMPAVCPPRLCFTPSPRGALPRAPTFRATGSIPGREGRCSVSLSQDGLVFPPVPGQPLSAHSTAFVTVESPPPPPFFPAWFILEALSGVGCCSP